MDMTINQISPRDPRAVRLLTDSQTLLASLFPAEENFFLDIDALCGPDIRFFAAQVEDEILGCAALRSSDGYGEIKSMYVPPEARGIGVARRLLSHLEGVARAEGLPVLRLETGTRLAAAQHLYEATGYVPRGPFGSYQANASSMFYEKALGSLAG